MTPDTLAALTARRDAKTPVVLATALPGGAQRTALVTMQSTRVRPSSTLASNVPVEKPNLPSVS